MGSDAGGSGTDGGGFTWSALQAPSEPIGALAGNGSGASVVLYAGYLGKLERFTAGNWNDVCQDSSNNDITALWSSSDDEVFAGASTELIACTANCTGEASFTSYSVPILAPSGICGLDGQHVYAVGNDNLNVGHMYAWDAGSPGWDDLGAPSTWTYFGGCWAAPDGTVYVAAQSNVVHYAAGAFTAETFQWPTGWTTIEIDSQYFTSVSGNGQTVAATGTNCRVFTSSGGSWSLAFDPGSICDGQQFNGLALDSTHGGLAAGVTSNAADALLSASGWAMDPASPTLFTALGVWVASPSEYYMAGGPTPGGSGLVYRGTR
jgi:hypothetical protein